MSGLADLYVFLPLIYCQKIQFMELFHKMISGFLGIPERQISSTLHLLGEGATIPFISRYRKEATGGLDEVQIEQIKEQHDKLCDIVKRKETILTTITEQGKLTAELEKRINDTWSPTELEDIYLPYKPKRKTRAEVARQKGLEPLATILLLQRENNLSAKAASFVKGEVKDMEDALKGARDIIDGAGERTTSVPVTPYVTSSGDGQRLRQN